MHTCMCFSSCYKMGWYCPSCQYIVHPHTFYLWGVFRGMDIWNWYDKVLTEHWWFPILHPNGQSWSERLLVSTLLCADVRCYSCDNFLEFELLGWKTKEAPQFLTPRRLCGCTIYIHTRYIYTNTHDINMHTYYVPTYSIWVSTSPCFHPHRKLSIF